MKSAKNFSKKGIDIGRIQHYLKRISGLKVLVIGDTIIDKYVFLYSNRIKEETYAGGILAIANHVGNFAGKVKVVTLLGDKKSQIGFIRKSMNHNVKVRAFVKENSRSIVKKKFIRAKDNVVLLKDYCIDDKPVSAALGNEIISCLGKEIPKYDLVITGDFGHGFINSGIRRKIEEKSKFLALNVQTNSSNFGHHPFTLYRKFDFLSMNMQELALALHEEHKDAKEMIRKCCKKLKINNFLVTLGKNGCTYVKNGIMINAPILTSSVKDTVGAGDAVFSVISLFVYLNAEKELIPFIASCAGGIGVNIMGNKESITKKKLLDFIKKTLKEK